MPQRIHVAVPLADVSGVRLKCSSATCGATTEVAVGQLRQRFVDPKCPVCKAAYIVADPARLTGGLDQLQRAFEALAGQVDAAFVVTDR